MFVAVARRLRRDRALIAVPLAFVFCNLTATVYDFATSHDPGSLAPAIPETIFLVIYSLFALSQRRARGGVLAGLTTAAHALCETDLASRKVSARSRDAFFCGTVRSIGQTPRMATKAQLFRYSEERSGPKQPKQPPRRRRDHPVDTAQPGVSATDRRAGGNSTAGRNRSKSAAKKASYVLEDSRERPSRKSTRRARNRQKPDNNLKRRQMRKTTSAAARARLG